jgi:uncharacterized membrane protein YfcA
MEQKGFYGFLGALITFVFLLALQTYLVRSARRRAAGTAEKRVVKFMDLIITSEDERYSLSRLQMYLWTVVVVIGYAAVFLSMFKASDIPQNLYLLMGVNLAASVTSTAIATRNGVKKPVGKPDFVKDIFFESEKSSLDLPRTQMFIWTIVSLCYFAIMLIQKFVKPGVEPSLPDIPTGLVVLMGVSHGAYLGAKATEKKGEEAAKPGK